jgi:hypothetical protein
MMIVFEQLFSWISKPEVRVVLGNLFYLNIYQKNDRDGVTLKLHGSLVPYSHMA